MFIQFVFSFFTIMLSSIFPTLSHPLSMGLVILVLTIILALMLGSLMANFWLSYVLILVFLGGLLVIFVYVSLLAPNELFVKKFNLKYLLGSGLVLSLLSLTYSMWVTQGGPYSPLGAENSESLFWVNSFYSEDLGFITIFFVFYLLLTLIVVVNITKHDYSSLRVR